MVRRFTVSTFRFEGEWCRVIYSLLCFIIALFVLLERFCGVPDDCNVGMFGLLIKSLD